MRRADRRDGRRDEAIDTNPLTPPNTLTHPPNPHIPSNPRTRPMCSGFPHVISRIAVVVECRPQSRDKAKAKAKASTSIVNQYEYQGPSSVKPSVPSHRPVQQKTLQRESALLSRGLEQARATRE